MIGHMCQALSQCQVHRRGPGGAVPTCLFTGKQTGRASRTQSVPSPSGGGRCWRRRERGKKHLHA